MTKSDPSLNSRVGGENIRSVPIGIERHFGPADCSDG
ncbi:hypothetical protein ABIE49_000085 [Bradyrhizobium sp. OAE829]